MARVGARRRRLLPGALAGALVVSVSALVVGEGGAVAGRDPRHALVARAFGGDGGALVELLDGADAVPVQPVAAAVPGVEPALVEAYLRSAVGGVEGAAGFLRAGHAAAELVARAPSSVLMVAEVLRELGREHGYRPGDAAAALEEARGDEQIGAWLVALLGVGESFERDRAAFLETIRAIDSETLQGEALAAAWIARSRLLLAMDRDEAAAQSLRNIEHERDGRVDAWAFDARLRLLELLGRDGQLLAMALEGLPKERPEPGDATAAERLSLAGEAALRLNEQRLGLLLLNAARDAQPERLARHERVVGLLLEEPGAVDSISLRSPLGRAMRTLRQHHPDAALLELVLVGEAVRRDQPALVVRTLEQLRERFPEDERIREQLVARWLDLEELDKARALVEARLEALPAAASGADMVLYGRVLAAEGMPDRAIQRLGTWIDEQGDDVRVLMELERLYRNGVFSGGDAERMRLRRLSVLPPTIEREIERAVVESSARDQTVAVGALRSAFERAGAVEIDTPARAWLGEVPDRVEPALTPEQRGMAIATIQGMVGRTAGTVPSAELVALFDAGAEALAPLPEDLATTWVSMVIVSGEGLDVAIETAERAAAGSRELRRVVFRALMQELGMTGRLNNAFVVALRNDPRSVLRVARAGALGGGGDDPELFASWAAAVYMAGAGDSRDERFIEVRRSAAEMAMRAGEAGLLRESLSRAADLFRSMPVADLCSRLARIADPDLHWDAAVLLYRQGLNFDPTHASLNNSYGYRLLERDEQIDLAEVLIERAVRADPKEPAYLDSLGWARYKRGMLFDEPRIGPLGEGREGAITLLERALELLGRVEDLDDDDSEVIGVLLNKPTILDHAGDAHWAAGNEELAIERWTAAGRRASDAADWIERRRIAALIDVAWVMREIERVKSSTAEKLDAARAGREVPIARIHGPVRERDDAAEPDGNGAGPGG